MRHCSGCDVLGAIEASKGILLLLFRNQGDVFLIVQSVKVADESNTELTTANVLALN